MSASVHHINNHLQNLKKITQLDREIVLLKTIIFKRKLLALIPEMISK